MRRRQIGERDMKMKKKKRKNLLRVYTRSFHQALDIMHRYVERERKEGKQ